MVQAEGLEAVFECLYPGALTHHWGIQGVFLADASFPPGVTRKTPFGGSPARLIILATQVYNNTVVQCNAVLTIPGGTAELLSTNATLQVQGTSNYFPWFSVFIAYTIL